MLSTTHSFTNCLLANTYKLSKATNSALYKRPTSLATSLVPKNIIPSDAAIECTSSKGIFCLSLIYKCTTRKFKEYILPSVLAANTAAPPSITPDISCVGSTSIIASAFCKSELLQLLLNGLISQTCSAISSLPDINKVFLQTIYQLNHLNLIEQ